MSLELLARFSYPVFAGNQRPDLAELFFSIGLGDRSHLAEMEPIIDGFPIIKQYFEVIGTSVGLHPYHPSVIEAYILGNELLDAPLKGELMQYADLQKYIQEKTKRPIIFSDTDIFHHNLHVNLVGYMTTTEPTEKEKRDCRVIPGTVEDEGVQLKLIPYKENVITDSRPYVPITNPFNISINGHVAVHRNIVIAALDDLQTQNLVTYGFNLQN